MIIVSKTANRFGNIIFTVIPKTYEKYLLSLSFFFTYLLIRFSSSSSIRKRSSVFFESCVWGNCTINLELESLKF